MVELFDYQKKAVKELKTGSILCGQVGSGKTITALAYYIFRVCNGKEKNGRLNAPRDLYVITTAKKRDELDWQKEAANFGLGNKDFGLGATMVVDSWNNIKKYEKVVGAMFIFDEQRVVGSGSWVKAFLKIAKKNQWILLSATPGDQWSDYIPIFVANGFYKNKTEFCNAHCIYSGFSNYPKIEKYVGTKHLEKLRDYILVDMKDLRETERHHIYINCSYDKDLYISTMKNRWDPYLDKPIEESSRLLSVLRRILNEDESRLDALHDILRTNNRLIVFYNFDYELDLLREFFLKEKIFTAEWNGHNHDRLPTRDNWAYLVQYTAGCEGWNCTTSDTMIFYSQTYSYKQLEQACGRIDRINTPFKDLYYYHLYSHGKVDLAIKRCLDNKKNFNERAFMKKQFA